MDALISPVVQIANRPGLFAVVSQDTARTIREGYMKLYLVNAGVMVETASRARKNLIHYGEYKLVFFAIDQNGRLNTSQA